MGQLVPEGAETYVAVRPQRKRLNGNVVALVEPFEVHLERTALINKRAVGEVLASYVAFGQTHVVMN